MKKASILLVFQLLCLASVGQTLSFGLCSQEYIITGSQIKPEFYTTKVQIEEIDWDITMTVGISAEFYYPLLKINDNFSLGGYVVGNFHGFVESDPGVDYTNGSTSGSTSSTFFGMSVPVGAMVKFGPGATREGDINYGGSLGFGMAYQAFNTGGKDKGSYFTPTLKLGIRIKNADIALNYSLTPYQMSIATNYSEITIPLKKYTNFGISFELKML